MRREVDTRSAPYEPFRLGEWLVEPCLNRLTRDGKSIQIEPKMMDVLVCLAEHADELVERRQLIDTVWATEFISATILTRAIAELRNALGDDARKPSFIETIHRRGYRLIAPIEAEVSDEQGISKIARFSVPERAPEDDRNPYPGLAAFTEEDAEFFFGREAEVSRVWRKLTTRRLLAVIGPSGVGKSSYLRAGLMPVAPEGWGCLICQPGEGPFASLARALAPEFEGDPEAISKLVDIGDETTAVATIARWRERHEQALLIVDQFEELFTLNPPEVQERFAELLARLARDADVHVLLSMRDDFLYRCHDHDALMPIFSELTPVKVPAAEDLRRALVQPAARLGHSFEDDGLADEMLEAVKDERGALPMLAFAVERLWEKRDTEKKVLTRGAYQAIGGVSGALAQHAESTLTAIGRDRLPIVRELFRNLVTAEGTRATREAENLLSVFPGAQREEAEHVLQQLTDARLLTSFEKDIVEGDAGHHRVEVVHESLLTSWPRLVRWQTQDADAAQLRDQLRQAARTWEEHNRARDYLWAGTAYREFSVWREGYPGGLTEVEEAFAAAMTSHTKRRKRRQRIALAAAFLVLLAVLGIVGVSRQQAIAEANRAEAAKLLALAQVQLEKDATEALAYATASLELADTEEARIFAMKALWHAPPAFVLAGAGMSGRRPFFSADGTWLAAAGHDDEVLVWPETGGEPLRLPGHDILSGGWEHAGWTAPGLLVTAKGRDHAQVWSMPEGQLVRTIDFSSPTRMQMGETHLLAVVNATVLEGELRVLKLRRWKLPDGQAEDLGSIDWTALGATNSRFDPGGRGWIFARGDTVYYRPLPLRDDEPVLVIGRHDNDAAVLTPRTREPDRVWSRDMVTGERRCWSLSTPSLEPLEMIPAPPEGSRMRCAVRSGTGTWRLGRISGEKAPWLWDLGLLPGGQPLELRANTNWYASVMDMHPAGKWLTASAENWDQLRFWPLVKTYPSVVEGYSGYWKPVEFSPDGEWLATGWGDGSLRLWPLPTGEPRELQVLEAPRVSFYKNLAFDRTGENLVTTAGSIFVVSLGGGTPRKLEGFPGGQMLFSTAFSPSGRLVAAGTGFGTGERKVLRVWDLETGEVRVFDLEGPPTEPEGSAESRAVETGWEHCVFTVLFVDESTLLTAGAGGVRRWNLETGTSEVVIQTAPKVVLSATMSDDQATLFTRAARFDPSGRFEGIAVHHLSTGTSRALDLFGDRVRDFTTDPTGEILVTGDLEGVVRVGRINAGEPHLLLGHEQQVYEVAISPDLEWVVSAGQDETLRLWPMPDLSKPPLHTLPREELIAKLKTLTNLRVVRDEDSPSGWKLTVGPFPGWETVPTW